MHELFETMGTGIIALLIVFIGVIEFLWAKMYLSANKEERKIMKRHMLKCISFGICLAVSVIGTISLLFMLPSLLSKLFSAF